MKKVLGVLGFLLLVGQVWAQDLIEMVKRDINAERRTLVAEAMNVSVDVETEFWHIYNDMEIELDKLMDLRVANIKKFAENIDDMNDDIADEIAGTYFEINDKRHKILKTYYKKMAKLISKVEAARFTQIMGQIQLLIDLQVSSELPLLE